MSIRKDNYVKATTSAGDLYGQVLSVRKDGVNITTSMGPARVARDGVTKLTFAEFKASNAVAVNAETFAKATPGIEAGTAPTRVGITVLKNGEPADEEYTNKVIEGVLGTAAPKKASVVRPGAKGTGKKAVAVAVFKELTVDGVIPTRKAFSTAMAERTGLSAKGASTYFYNLKSGRWA